MSPQPVPAPRRPRPRRPTRVAVEAQGREGRPTKFSKPLAQQILKRLKVGWPLEPACQAEGIGYRTFRTWLTDFAERPDPQYEPFRQFRQAVLQTVARVEGRVVEEWLKAKDWRAKLAYLARRWPQRWGETAQEEAGGKVVPVTIQFRYYPEGYDPGATLPSGEGAVDVAVRVGDAPPVGRASVQGLVEVDDVPLPGPPDPTSRFVTREL